MVEGKGLQILPEQSARGFESRSRLAAKSKTSLCFFLWFILRDQTLSCGWITISLMKDLTRDKYHELRRIVRRNISANSREVMLKKYNYLCGYAVMGGVVLEKQEFPKRIWQCGRFGGALESLGVPEYGYARGRMSIKVGYPLFKFKLFDFSGVFELTVSGNRDDPAEEVRLRNIRKGDVVFAVGSVQFGKDFGKLWLSGRWVGFDYELINRRAAHPEEFIDSEQTMEIVKQGGYYGKKVLQRFVCGKTGVRVVEGPIQIWTLRDLAYCEPLEAIRSFFRMGQPIERIQDFLHALHYAYSEYRYTWIPALIVLYFRKHVVSGMKHVSSPDGAKQLFLKWFPDIKGLIKWPGNDIQNLQLKRKGESV